MNHLINNVDDNRVKISKINDFGINNERPKTGNGSGVCYTLKEAKILIYIYT